MSINREAILKSYSTVIEMFEERDRKPLAEDLRKIGVAEIDQLLRNGSIFTIDIRNDVRIIYCLEPKVKTADLKKYIEDTEFQNYLIILRDKLSATNQKSIQEMNKPVEMFELRELQYNISKHILVPKHRLIIASDQNTINAIFQKLGIKSRSQLPAILKTDPMARFLNAKTGDLVEITRYSPTCGEHIFYRICV